MAKFRIDEDDYEYDEGNNLVLPKTMEIPVIETEDGKEVGLTIEVDREYEVYPVGVELAPVGHKPNGGYNAVMVLDGEIYLVQNIDWE